MTMDIEPVIRKAMYLYITVIVSVTSVVASALTLLAVYLLK